MESEFNEDFEKLPYYQRIIQSHHHEFEGLYFAFINYTTNTIEYSEFISVNKIKMILPPEINNDTVDNIYEIIDDNTVQVKLNLAESRYFDYNNNLPDKESPHEKYTLLLNNLNEHTIEKIKNFNQYIKEIEDKIEEIDEIDEKTDTKEENDKEKKIVNIDQTGGRLFNLRKHYDLTIIYKVYEPVILSVCKYVAKFDKDVNKRFYSGCRVQILGSPLNGIIVAELIPGMYVVEINGIRRGIPANQMNPIDNRVDFFIDAGGNILEDRVEQWMNSRWTDNDIDDQNISMCCYSILDHSIHQFISIKFNMFDVTEYNLKKTHHKYLDSPFYSMYDLNLAPAYTLLLPHHNTPANVIKVKIMQEIINQMIVTGGRDGGPELRAQQNYYPKIHLLELLDPNNDIWIMRSEHYHLSKSPCVHNGLAFKGKINYFLKYLNLWPNNDLVHFEAVTWIHNIAHGLDRLYCGTPVTHIAFGGEPKKWMFYKILHYFQIFIRIMNKNKFPICGVIPYLNRYSQNYTELFFYICMNDMNSIQRKLSRQKSPNDDGVNDSFLLELKATSNSQVAFTHGDDRQPLIDDIIARIKRDFDSPRLNGFPFFNYQYSFQPIPNSTSFNIKPNCYDVKRNTYHCRPQVSNNLWREMNPKNINANDPTLSANLHNENYVSLNPHY